MRFSGLILSVCFLCFFCSMRAEERHIVIDKPNLRLYVIEDGDTLFNVRVACGINFGNKEAKKDFRTPEGDFTVSDIHDARAWLHQNKDGSWSKDVYGPWYIRLATPKWSGIGIHGTKVPASIGHRRSEGCIRMLNSNIEKLVKLVDIGMPVKILPDKNN